MDLTSLLPGVEAAAREAGALIQRIAREGFQVRYKGSIDLVTEADKAAETLLVDRLGTLLPEAEMLAEEGGGQRSNRGLRWIVDPLDGTTNFAHGYPAYCVSIGLEEEGRVMLGVVHDPTREETFSAVRGGGARVNDRPLRVSTEPGLDRALLVTGFPYDTRESARDNLLAFAAFAKRAQGLRRDGSAALNLSYLAAGRFDGYWEEKLSPWDIAAGTLFVEEAGGRVTDYHGGPLRLEQGHLVASNGHVHDAMLEVLAEIEGSGRLPPVVPRQY